MNESILKMYGEHICSLRRPTTEEKIKILIILLEVDVGTRHLWVLNMDKLWFSIIKIIVKYFTSTTSSYCKEGPTFKIRWGVCYWICLPSIKSHRHTDIDRRRLENLLEFGSSMTYNPIILSCGLSNKIVVHIIFLKLPKFFLILYKSFRFLSRSINNSEASVKCYKSSSCRLSLNKY